MFFFGEWISNWWYNTYNKDQDEDIDAVVHTEIIALDDAEQSVDSSPSPVRRTYASVLLSSIDEDEDENSCVGVSCDTIATCKNGNDVEIQCEDNNNDMMYLEMARKLVDEAIKEAIASLSEDEFSARFPQYCHHHHDDEDERYMGTRDPEPEYPSAPEGYVGKQDGTVPISLMTEFSPNYDWRMYEMTVGEMREAELRKWLCQERFHF